MKWFDSFISWLFPTLLLEGTPWLHMWEEKERESFVLVSRIFFPLATITYIAHFFFYDLANDLQPIELWLRFRLFMSSVCFLAFLFYCTPFVRWGGYKLPALVSCWIICQSQAFVASWHGLESWIFCYVLILICVLVLRMSVLKSILYAVACIFSQAIILLEADISQAYIFTGSIVTIVTSLVVRTSYLGEVRSFLLNQENIAAQKRIIELNIDFADRIRSFIPKVISGRIDRHMEEERMSVIEASIEVLTPKKREVSCLFSDIRGFTQGSKDLEAFIKESVIPEVKACSDAVEGFGGIPRKVGDLIFAYFDEESIERNVVSSAAAAMAISRLNHDMNETANVVKIRRYVLLSHGEALVGNLGGLDSSIEITALGSPVNFLSRLDEATKDSALADRLSPGDLVLSPEFSKMLASLVPDIVQSKIDLQKIGVSIRDFGDVHYIYSISPSEVFYSKLVEALDAELTRSCGTKPSGRVAA